MQVADRLNSIDRRLDGMDQRIDAMDQRIDAMDQRLTARIDGLGARLDARIDAFGAELRSELRTTAIGLGSRIDALGSRSDALGTELRKKMDGQFRWLVAILVTCGAATTGTWVAMLHVFLVLAKPGH